MTKTLLEIVQDILIDIDGDEVNSITDTVEAEQVANIVKNAYEAIVSAETWPHTRRALVLNAFSDSAKPTHCTLQSNVKELCKVFYDKAGLGETQKKYTEVKYLEPDHFLMKLNARNNTKTNVTVITDGSGIDLLIQTDKHPEYYTSFNDVDLVFDSYDSAVDSTLQISKIQAIGYILPTFTVSDSFVPDLPPDAFSLLTEEATSRANMKLRQFQDVKAEQAAAKQNRSMSRKNWRTNGGITYPNYGRHVR